MIFIAGKDPLQKGGHASYVRAHARAAVRLGFEPHLFYVGPENRTVECEFGILHEIASWARPFRPIALPAHSRRFVSALKTFLEGKPGPYLLHTFGLWCGIGIEVASHARQRGSECVNIASVYTTLKHEYSARLEGAMGGVSAAMKVLAGVEYSLMWYLRATREARHLKHADLILVNYDSVSRIIASEYGGGIKCRKVPYCSEMAFLRKVGDSPVPAGLERFEAPDAPLIVAVSRHDPRKGIDYLLPALAALKGSGVRFRACLVGGGPLTEPHRKFASNLGLDGWVSITGWVPDAFAYLEQADIFVLPSIEEGSGSVALLEALQAGAPIVASGIDGIPEDVTEEEALLVEPRSSEALAGALKRLLVDAPLRARMSKSARKKYETSFSPEAMTLSLGQVYAECGFHPDNV